MDCRPTKESLAAMGKLLKKEGESTKISVRYARKNTMDALKNLSSEDERKRLEKQVKLNTKRFNVLPFQSYGCCLPQYCKLNC
jgi:ribosome recycling factor